MVGDWIKSDTDDILKLSAGILYNLDWSRTWVSNSYMSRVTSYIVQGSIIESTNSAKFTQHQQITNNTDVYFINLINWTDILQVK